KFLEARKEAIEVELQLALKESPPPAFPEIARRLGYKIDYIQKRFSTLCRAITARHAAHRKEQQIRKSQLYKEEVRQIVIELHGAGVYPTHKKVLVLLKNPPFKSFTLFNSTLREIREELGLSAKPALFNVTQR